MATSEHPEHQLVQMTVPAKYLEDLRTGLINEITADSQWVCGMHAEVLRGLDAGVDDRAGAARWLRGDMELLDRLLDTAGDAEIVGEQGPMTTALCEMVLALAKRLEEEGGCSPLDMGAVLDLTDRLRWAAEQATRLNPGLDPSCVTVTLTREQRDAVFTEIGQIGQGEGALLDRRFLDAGESERVRTSLRRLNTATRLLDQIGWEAESQRDTFPVVLDDDLAEFAVYLADRGREQVARWESRARDDDDPYSELPEMIGAGKLLIAFGELVAAERRRWVSGGS